MELTKEYLHSILQYRDDGQLIWRVKHHRQSKIGHISTIEGGQGYKLITINGKKYRAHRIIFLMHHGYLPKYIDHINRDRSDNRIENLREADLSINNRNTSSRKNSTSKYLGVHWTKRHKKWQVCIKENGKNKHLGLYTDEEEAARVYDKWALKIHGEYANMNFPIGD